MYDTDFSGPKDAPKDNYVIKDGVKVNIIHEDPYGHYYLVPEKGLLPERLQGKYTNVDIAKQDINTHYYYVPKKKDLSA